MRAISVLREERQHHLRAHLAGELALGLLGRLAHAQHRRAVARQVDLLRALELAHQVIRQPLVEVVAAQVVVAAGGQHLDHAVADLDERHVERAAAQVVHQDLLRLTVIQAVRERRRRRLVDDAQHVQPRDAARVLGRLALRVGEVRRDGDDRLGHAFA